MSSGKRKGDPSKLCKEIANIIEKGEMLPWKSHLMIGALTGKIGAGVNWMGTPYKGINAMVTMGDILVNNRRNAQYVTFHKAHELGGSVNKGAKSITVVFSLKSYVWKRDNRVISEEERDELIAAGRATAMDFYDYWVSRKSSVFSIEDTTLEPDPAYSVDLSAEDMKADEKRIEKADAIVKGYENGPRIVTANSALIGSNAAGAYIPDLDTIQIMPIGSFDMPEAYYSALFHEMAHSTGNPKRLNRDMGTDYGKSDYAREELIAEFASAVLLDRAGILLDDLKKEDAFYISSWARHIEDMDDRSMSVAINQALQAADWITGDRRGKEKADE